MKENVFGVIDIDHISLEFRNDVYIAYYNNDGFDT